MGDRGGGREAKGTSLRLSKKNPGAPAARSKAKPGQNVSLVNLPPPPPGPGSYIDCGAALLSRHFDKNRAAVVRRTRDEGDVAAVVVWSSAATKQQEIADLAKENEGLCYFLVGFHPDNVGKGGTTDKKWLSTAEELARRGECIGVLSGLHLGREVATHFAQKTFFQAAVALCDKFKLPMVLHLAGDELSFDTVVDLLREAGWLPELEANGAAPPESDMVGGEFGYRHVILHDAVTALQSDPARVSAAVAAGMVLSIAATGIATSDGGDNAAELTESAKACVAAIPMDRLVVCSDSPWHTPQNLPDEYLRTLGNEPANLPSVVSAVAAARGLQGPEALALFKVSLFRNALRVFGLPSAAPPEVPTPEVVTAAPTDAAPAKDTDGVPPEGNGVPTDGTAVASGTDVVAEIERELGTASDGVNSQDNVQNEARDGDESGDEENDATAEANELNLADLTVSAGAAPHYRCHKCRAFLFYKEDVLTHATAASRTIYKDAGGDALCDAVVFVRHIEPDDEDVELLERKGGTAVINDGSDDSDDRSDVDGPPMVILDKNVHCSNCSAKVGRFAAGEASCTCGATVPGPTVRLTATKLDFVVGPTKLKTLVDRSRAEAEAAQNEGDSKKDKKKKKKKRSKMQITGPDGIGLGRNLQRGTAPKGGPIGGR